MILGILSDTHGQVARTQRAVALLRRCGATQLIHCGDFGGADVLAQLAALPAVVVPGNTDTLDGAQVKYAATLGVRLVPEGPAELTLGDRRVLVFHGHERGFARLVEALERNGHAAGATCDYVCYGHSHLAADQRFGGCRLINPGALQRASVYTVATLDVTTDTLRFWRMTDDGDGRAPREYALD